MVLTARQHSRIAAIYEQASADKSLPVQSRSSFAKKASWFRLTAEVRLLLGGNAPPPTGAHSPQGGNIVLGYLTPFACRNDLPAIAAQAASQPLAARVEFDQR